MLDLQLLNAVTVAGAGTSYRPTRRQVFTPVESGVFQAIITGVASVNIEGSADGINWAQLANLTNSGIIAIQLCSWMRANVISYTSGTVTAFLSS